MPCNACEQTIKTVADIQPQSATYSLVLMTGHDNVQKAFDAHAHWSSTHYIPGITHYCNKCRKITWLTSDCDRFMQEELVASMRKRVTNYWQTNPGGQDKQ